MRQMTLNIETCIWRFDLLLIFFDLNDLNASILLDKNTEPINERLKRRTMQNNNISLQ